VGVLGESYNHRLITATSRIIYYVAVISVSSVAILFSCYMLTAGFLVWDGFRPVPQLSFAGWWPDIALWHTFFYSAIVALLASIIAYLGVEAFIQEDLRIIDAVALIMFYCFDPVVRTLSLRGLLLWYTKYFVLSSTVQRYIVPALALAVTYAPLYAIIRAWDIPKKDHITSRWLGFLYSRIQPSVQRAPMLLSILILMCIADPWVARLVQFNKSEYWGWSTLYTAVGSRNPATAVRLCLLGLLFCLFMAGGLFTLRILWERWFKTLKPGGSRLNAKGSHLRTAITVLLMLWASWTAYWMYSEAQLNQQYGAEVDIVGVLSLSVVLSLGAAVCSVVVGSLLVLARLCHGQLKGVILASSLLLALSPELAFTLMSNTATSAGIVQPGFLWALIGIVAYTGPVTFIFVDTFIAQRLNEYTPILATVASLSVIRAARVLTTLLRQQMFLMALLVMWLVLEDIIFLQYSLGASGSTIAVAVYGGSSHGFRKSIAFVAMWGAIVKLGIMLLAVAILTRESEQ
jgi:hypothetical protein